MIKKKYNFSFTHSFKKKINLPKNINELRQLLKEKFIVIGNLRSYNDTIISNGKYVSLENFKKIINFNKKRKFIEVESGLTLYELNRIILKQNLILPCKPGCKYVSIGGMVANNISGKLLINNSLKSHILSIIILNKRLELVECSQKKNKKLFNLTIGGRGRTGPIISVKFKLEKIKSSEIFQKNYYFDNYLKFNEILRKLKDYKYAVCWLDFTKNNFDGIIFAGRHLKNSKKFNYRFIDIKLINVLVILIGVFVKSKIFTIIFNRLFKLKNILKQSNLLTFNDFFFPQNKLINWNEFFKQQGFIQFQIYVDKKNLLNLINFIKSDFIKHDLFSNFAVIKFHNYKSINFKRFSLSLDLPINNNKKLISDRLNLYIKKFNLEVDLAKDVSMKKLNKKTLNLNPVFKTSNLKYININFESKLFKRLQNER